MLTDSFYLPLNSLSYNHVPWVMRDFYTRHNVFLENYIIHLTNVLLFFDQNFTTTTPQLHSNSLYSFDNYCFLTNSFHRHNYT